MRVSEMAHITLSGLHLERKEVDIVAKGRKPRTAPFGTDTARALDRYLRQARSTHPKADLPWLWLGPKGQLTDSGIRQLLDERASQAGLGHHNPHQFRHAFAASLKRQQAPHEVIKRIGGWETDAMVNRYGAKDADDRARAAYPQYSPMDRLRHR